MERSIRALKKALGTTVLISFKACPIYDIIARLPCECWDGVELASRGELYMFTGQRPRHFYVNTPALTESLVRAALSASASLVIDAPSQLSLINKVRGKRRVRPVSLRLSNRLIEQFRPDAPRLRPDQFGMDLQTVHEVVDTSRRLRIDIEGVHLFAGPHAFGRVAKHMAAIASTIVTQIEERLGHRLRIANLGGGLEENWPDKSHEFPTYRSTLSLLPPHLEIVHEFGRAIFATAGVFATRVIATKMVMGQRYAICDGGMAQAFLLAQTENILRKHRIPRVANRCAGNSGKAPKTLIVGSTCSRDDFIGETTDELQEGDVLLFEGCGAYYRTYSMNNFLALSEPNVYVL